MTPAAPTSTGPLAALIPALAVGVVLPAVMVIVVVFSAATATGIGFAGGCGPGGGPGGGATQLGEHAYTAEQMTIAHTIVDTTASRGLPTRAAVLAVATALVESGLENLDHGDRDSLGVFQQRPSQGWGSAAQLLDPVYATNAFLDALVAIPGWRHLPPGVAEQLVQRSAFPERYAPRHREAISIVDRFWTGYRRDGGTRRPVSAGCRDEGGSNIPLEAAQLPDGFTLPDDPRRAAAVSYALAQVGKPYVWGAKGPDAFDCSGLMLAAWAHAGVAIGASTTTQIHDGRPITTLSAAEPGDLLFIPGALGTTTNPRHVGMYAGHGLIVNAYDADTGVVIERLDAWMSQVVAIRRVAEPAGAGA